MIHLLIVAVLVVISTIAIGLFLTNAPILPVEASNQAVQIDSLFHIHFWLIAFFFSLIVVFIVYSLVVFRRRKGESSLPGGIVEERRSKFAAARTPWIALGLYLGAASIGLIKGLDGVFALMEPRLARRLGSYGIKFVQVGEPVEHRGERAPFFISRNALYAGLPPLIHGLLEVIEKDLRRTGAELSTGFLQRNASERSHQSQ